MMYQSSPIPLRDLATTENITDFIEQYSETPFDSIYKTKGVLANEYADILFGLNPGDIFGPYKDRNDIENLPFSGSKKGRCDQSKSYFGCL